MSVKSDDILINYPDAQKIAEGGQKEVFSIEHPSFGACVLKIGRYPSAKSFERIQREYDELARMSSPYFPKAYEMKLVDDSRFIIIEERIPANPLSAQLHRFSDFPQATRLIVHLIEGLKILWDKNIIHRDVKPANILVNNEGKIWIIDLGIARFLDMDSITKTIALSGPCTPFYAAPEQLANRKNEINHRCDQFIAGIVFAQLLLKGMHPFDPRLIGNTSSLVENIASGTWAESKFQDQPLIRAYPVIKKMLGKEPFERYRKPESLLTDLNGLLN